MNGFQQICLSSQGLQSGRVIGLQQVADIDLLRLKVDELLPGQVDLHVTPDPLNRVQLGTVGWEPYGLHMCRPSNPLSRMGATVIQEQEIEAVGKGLRQGVDEELKGVGIQIRQLQEQPLARGRGDGAVDVEPFKGLLDRPHGLNPAGRQPSAAHGESPHTPFILAEHTHRSGLLRWHGTLQRLLTGRLQRGNGFRVFWCDWGVGP
jgi:hypothetical protein